MSRDKGHGSKEGGNFDNLSFKDETDTLSRLKDGREVSDKEFSAFGRLR